MSGKCFDLKLGPPKFAYARHSAEPPEMPDKQIRPRRTLPLVPDKFVKAVQPEPPDVA